MKSTLVIGYDVERIPGRVPGEKWVGRPVPVDTTTRFLTRIVDVHRAVNVPATIFMVGANIEAHRRELEACLASGLFEIAQHTHEHYPLKTVVEETGSRVYLKGLDFARIEEQIARPCELLKRHLGVECKGLTTPYTHYRGLSDRPDILEIIARYGMVYTRSYGRNSLDYFPLDWDIQPFFYERQGSRKSLSFRCRAGSTRSGVMTMGGTSRRSTLLTSRSRLTRMPTVASAGRTCSTTGPVCSATQT